MMILLLRQDQAYRQGRAWREMATVHVVALRDAPTVEQAQASLYERACSRWS
ncbi:hypothetical protein [Pseudomonas sp. PSB11]|uniref:hypothetical protein n=1 Tax=Pseudomonas sp. PSB11 TaxID=2021969 RepID=UPI0016614C3A|nr:hypothetical protein [Pseudomonas sp. PSB11]